MMQIVYVTPSEFNILSIHDIEVLVLRIVPHTPVDLKYVCLQ